MLTAMAPRVHRAGLSDAPSSPSCRSTSWQPRLQPATMTTRTHPALLSAPICFLLASAFCSQYVRGVCAPAIGIKSVLFPFSVHSIQPYSRHSSSRRPCMPYRHGAPDSAIHHTAIHPIHHTVSGALATRQLCTSPPQLSLGRRQTRLPPMQSRLDSTRDSTRLD